MRDEHFNRIREYVHNLIDQGKSPESALDHAAQYFGIHKDKLKLALGWNE